MLHNYTPHDVNIVDGPTFKSEGVARIQQADIVESEIDGVLIYGQYFGEPEGLPDPKPGECFIVSRMVAEACSDRRDLYVPGPLVRDEKGAVIGCKGLSYIKER